MPFEAQLNVQRRLADAKFIRADTFEEIQDQHAAFVQLFNTTRHWAHRERADDRLTPVAVLDGRLGREVTPEQLHRVFRHLQFTRTVNSFGRVSIQRYYIYAEHGLARRRVSVWVYENRLHIEYQQRLLARYSCRLKRSSANIARIWNPKLYRTIFASPQLELFEIDETEWHKVWRRPEYAKRRNGPRSTIQQLALDLMFMISMFGWL